MRKRRKIAKGVLGDFASAGPTSLEIFRTVQRPRARSNCEENASALIR